MGPCVYYTHIAHTVLQALRFEAQHKQHRQHTHLGNSEHLRNPEQGFVCILAPQEGFRCVPRGKKGTCCMLHHAALC